MSKEKMLTTIDNPFNPFKQFDEWFAFDIEQGYNTCALLARVCSLSDELSDEQINSLIDNSIDEIVDNDLTNKYIKCYEDTKILVNSS